MVLVAGSELPRVSGATARVALGRLASVSRAASSQEPEPAGPEDRERTEPPTRAVPSLPAASGASAPHHRWPLALAPPRGHLGAADAVSSPPPPPLLHPQRQAEVRLGRSRWAELPGWGRQRLTCSWGLFWTLTLLSDVRLLRGLLLISGFCMARVGRRQGEGDVWVWHFICFSFLL